MIFRPKSDDERMTVINNHPQQPQPQQPQPQPPPSKQKRKHSFLHNNKFITCYSVDNDLDFPPPPKPPPKKTKNQKDPHSKDFTNQTKMKINDKHLANLCAQDTETDKVR